MTDKREREYEEQMVLTRARWRVKEGDSAHLRNHTYDGGEVSIACIHVQTAAEYVLKTHGYCVNSDVINDGHGSVVDIIGYGTLEGTPSPLAVIIDAGTHPETKKRKREKLTSDEPFEECFVLEAVNAPDTLQKLHEWVELELFGVVR